MTSATVVLSDGTDLHAVVNWIDEEHDLAVLVVHPAERARFFSHTPLSSDQVVQGESVTFVGYGNTAQVDFNEVRQYQRPDTSGWQSGTECSAVHPSDGRWYDATLLDRPELPIVTKCELPESDETATRLSEEIGKPVLKISAVTGKGLPELTQLLLKLINPVENEDDWQPPPKREYV